jgi:hypothetical protein
MTSFRLIVLIILVGTLKLHSRNDSIAKKWRQCIGVHTSYFVFLDKMPYWKNNLTYEMGFNFTAYRSIRKLPRMKVGFAGGFAYRRYLLSVPDLSRRYFFFDNPFEIYKNISLRYFNFPVSYSFIISLQKRNYLAFGQTFNLLYMPSKFYINERYEVLSTQPSHSQQLQTQVNEVNFSKRELVPNLFLGYGLKIRERNQFDIFFSSSIVNLLFLKDGGDSNSNRYFNKAYSVQLFTRPVLFSGMSTSISYKYYFN